jgi:hypothetical protein
MLCVMGCFGVMDSLPPESPSRTASTSSNNLLSCRSSSHFAVVGLFSERSRAQALGMLDARSNGGCWPRSAFRPHPATLRLSSSLTTASRPNWCR